MIRKLWLALIASSIIGCMEMGSSQTTYSAATEESRTVPSPFVGSVIRILEENRRSGSLEYKGQCTSLGNITDSFKVSSTSPNRSPVDTLRQMLSANPSVSVKEEKGIIRVIGGDVGAGVLNVKINEVTFQNQTNPNEATAKLLGSPELKPYLESHHTEFVLTSGGIFSLPNGRQITATLKNVTLSQALDTIVRTFPGVWVYAECASKQGGARVSISFHQFSNSRANTGP